MTGSDVIWHCSVRPIYTDYKDGDKQILASQLKVQESQHVQLKVTTQVEENRLRGPVDDDER